MELYGWFLLKLVASKVYAPKVMNWLLMTTQLKSDCVDRYGPHILTVSGAQEKNNFEEPQVLVTLQALYLVLGLCFFTMSPAEQVQLVIAISFCRIVCIRVIVVCISQTHCLQSFDLLLLSWHIFLTQVTLTDGDHLTLANMRSNLELNQLSTDTSLLESYEDPNVVSFSCKNFFSLAIFLSA